MARTVSFPYVCGPGPRALILGTMPGEASLRLGQYYGHSRNSFWRIMGALAGFDHALPYSRRLEELARAGIALWDVLENCEREGSLDSAIRDEAPNAIAELLDAHPSITVILFNGGPAWRLFRKHFPGIVSAGSHDLRVLPSTSPACARYTFAEKLERWREGLSGANDARGLSPRHGASA